MATRVSRRVSSVSVARHVEGSEKSEVMGPRFSAATDAGSVTSTAVRVVIVEREAISLLWGYLQTLCREGGGREGGSRGKCSVRRRRGRHVP